MPALHGHLRGSGPDSWGLSGSRSPSGSADDAGSQRQWAGKLAERVAKSQQDFVRASIAESERRIIHLLAGSEHRHQVQISDALASFRKELQVRQVPFAADSRPPRHVDLAAVAELPTPREGATADAPGVAKPKRARRGRRSILPVEPVEWQSAEVCEAQSLLDAYDTAFAAAGGSQALEQSREVRQKACAELVDPEAERLVASLLVTNATPRGGAGGLSALFLRSSQACQPYVPDLETLYRGASAALPGFQAKIKDFAARSGGRAHVAALKPAARARTKAQLRYVDFAGVLARGGGGGASSSSASASATAVPAWYRLTDLVRATVSFPDIAKMYGSLDLLRAEFGREAIRELSDRYIDPLPGGYRSLQVLIEHSGHVCELVLSTESMTQVREVAGPSAHELSADFFAAICRGDAALLKEAVKWAGARISPGRVLPQILNLRVGGRTLLHEATRLGGGSGELAYYLLAHHADPNIQDGFGNTPLHLAVQSGFEQAAWALADFGHADLTITNTEGYSALHLGVSALWQQPHEDNLRRTVQMVARRCSVAQLREVLALRLEELETPASPRADDSQLRPPLRGRGPGAAAVPPIHGFDDGYSFPPHGELGGPARAPRHDLHFSEHVEMADAASAASRPGQSHPLRLRISTGHPGSAGPEDQRVWFAGGVQEVDAASLAVASGMASPVRGRVQTGYEFGGGPGGVRIDDDAEQLEAASAGVTGSAQSVRTRIATGYVRSADLPQDRRGLQFIEEAEELQAASLASGVAASTLRTRVHTGFAREEDVPAAAHRVGVQFTDEPEELEAASAATKSSPSAVRGRVGTGFVRPEEMPAIAGRRGGIQFNDEPEQLEAATTATKAAASPVRGRVGTGFVRPEEMPRDAAPRLRISEEEARQLQFAEQAEVLDAASAATGSSAKSVRTRINTGFARESDVPKDESRSGVAFREEAGGPPQGGARPQQALQFKDAVEWLEAASAAAGASARSVRDRVNTGFAREDDVPKEKKSLQFNDQAEQLDAASQSAGGEARSLRTRINTGFVHGDDDGAAAAAAAAAVAKAEAALELPGHATGASGARRGLHFDNDVQELDAASASVGGPHASARDRAGTGFVAQRVLQFSEQAEQLQAASEGTVGPGRCVRTRVNTGFVHHVSKEEPEVRTKALQFTQAPEVLAAASAATEGQARACRTRVNTGFAWDKDLPKEPRKALGFTDEAEQLDAASAATEGAGRSVRGRINTGFAFEAETPSPDTKALQFKEEAEQLDAASAATEGPVRSVRTRINTGFARETDMPSREEPQPMKGLQFHEQVEELDAASQGTEGYARSCRGRISTGFAREADVPSEPKRALQFSEEAEELDAASGAVEGESRSVRGRVATGYSREAEPKRALQFQVEAEQLDAASGAVEGEARSVRGRVATGYSREAEPKRALQFQVEAEQLDAASGAVEGEARSVRGRVATGYSREAEPKRTLQFQVEAEQLDAASGAAEGEARSVRGRVATGYSREAEPKRGLQFQDEAEQLDAASGAVEGEARSVRGRVATGYSREAEPRRAPQFQEEAEQLDAASVGADDPPSCRGRAGTGYVREVPKEPKKAAPRFQEDVEQLDAASAATDGQARSVRGRVSTGFERGGFEERKALQFRDEAEQLEAASGSTDGPTRSVRGRVATGFAREADIPSEPPKALHFQEQAEHLDAASGATDGPARSVRGRVATGFATETDVPSEPSKAPHFREEVEQLDAASSAVEGMARSVRGRVATGFADQADMPSDAGKMLHFQDEAEHLDAASGAVEGESRSVRGRVATGYAREADMPKEPKKVLQFQEEAEQLDAASAVDDEEALRSIRGRVSTGYAREAAEQQPAGGGTPAMPAEEGQLGQDHGRRGPADDGEPADQSWQERTSQQQHFNHRMEGLAMDSPSRRSGGVMFQEELSSGTPSSRKPPLARQSSVKFAPGQPSIGRSASESSTSSRDVRMRVHTGFSDVHYSPSNSDEESDGEADSQRSSLLSRRLSSKRLSRQNSRRQTLEGALCAALERRKLGKTTIGDPVRLPQDSPEALIDDHLVPNAEKDTTLLQKSLKPLYLFQDLDESSLSELIDDMSVFEFQDGEEVVRQGDSGGTFFFVVAQGVFEIVKNGTTVAKLSPGDSFGESVLLIDGTRTATVKSQGYSRIYGMEAEDVREALRFSYQSAHKQVTAAVEKIIDSERCEQLAKLNAFQLHLLHTATEVQSFETGDVVFPEHELGAPPLDSIYVLVQGGVIFRKGDRDLQRVPRYTMFGQRGMLFGDVPFNAVADGSTKVLVLGRHVLEELFGARMHMVLLHTDIFNSLCLAEKVPAAGEARRSVQEMRKGSVGRATGFFEAISEDKKDLMAWHYRVIEVHPGKDLFEPDIRLVMLLHGPVQISTDGFTGDIRNLSGENRTVIGMEQMLSPELPWDITVRAASAYPSYVAVWQTADVHQDMVQDELERKLKIIKSVFLFRTLSANQLHKLAASMVNEHFQQGEKIFAQGDMGGTFYIIGSGRVFIEKDGRYIRALTRGDYFGERALLNQEPRSATITASEACVCWSMTHKTFEEVMPTMSLDYLRGRIGLQDQEYTFEDFTFVRVVGTGGFGVVKMVQTKGSLRYAMKCVKKRPIVDLAQQETLQNERSILSSIDHPFIIRLVQSFRSDYFVYFLIELVSGGELLDALAQLGLLDQTQAQFYSCSIILAFEHLHERRIAYLDLKSENVLLDYQGYIKIVDFGLAVKVQNGICHAVKGTPHFMAPEMILSKGYTTTADLWALGICIYEFMLGELPFGNRCTVKADIFRAVLKAPLVFPESFMAKSYSEVAISLMRGLLDRSPGTRLGAGIEGYAELLNHPFFENVDWDGLIGRRVPPPFVPAGERYADDTDGGDAANVRGRCFADVEAAIEAKEQSTGWVDPDPGWDDDFS